MSNRKSFVLGLFIGVISGLAPDLISAMQVYREQPEMRVHLTMLYAALGVGLLIALYEI